MISPRVVLVLTRWLCVGSFLVIESSNCAKIKIIKIHSIEHLHDYWEVYVDKLKTNVRSLILKYQKKINIPRMFATNVNKDDFPSSWIWLKYICDLKTGIMKLRAAVVSFQRRTP